LGTPNRHLLMDWMTEIVPDIKGSSKLYKFLCFFLGRRKTKLTYQELYLFLYSLNAKKMGWENARKRALERVLEIYKENNNNNLPKGL